MPYKNRLKISDIGHQSLKSLPNAIVLPSPSSPTSSPLLSSSSSSSTTQFKQSKCLATFAFVRQRFIRGKYEVNTVVITTNFDHQIHIDKAKISGYREERNFEILKTRV
ncbi:hypothetical protein GQX74_007700 [Glossina fuscipes]|nr:hypothetical protein GQX74_007700 [Glossina fuscipes]